MTVDRLERYLLGRLNRRSLRIAYRAAVAADILRAHQRTIGMHPVTIYTPGARAVTLTGATTADRRTLLRSISRDALLPVLPPVTVRRHDIDLVIEDTVGDIDASGTGAETEATPAEAVERPQLREGSGDHSQYLVKLAKLLQAVAHPPPITETVIVLSIVEAIRRSHLTAAQVLEVLSRPAPVVLLRLPIRGFEQTVGLMIEHGIIGRAMRLRDGGGGYSLSRRIHSGQEPHDQNTLITFRAGEITNQSTETRRQLLAKALSTGRPVLVAAEDEEPWPDRMTSSADLILDAPKIDWQLLGQAIEITTGHSRAEVEETSREYTIELGRLGLGDFALAIKPGRTISNVLSRLESFAQEDADVQRDDEGAGSTKQTVANGERGRTSSGSERSRRVDKTLSMDIIQPAQLPAITNGKRAAQHLRVEQLTGYGDARQWALDLKTDLVLWGSKEVYWADMSTKLLLSGPPGTGKTTFARALCNSLQIPLLATSVGQWLEPGYLGDVLKRMTAVFEVAKEHGPAILFIDEVDGIGRRDGGAGRTYDDYWISVVNRLLELLDGTAKSEGLIVVGATNRPGVIDPAIRRSGRLERHIEIPLPDIDALEGIIRHHLGGDFRSVLASANQSVSGRSKNSEGAAHATR
ncbi:ATP-binding protein [Rhizobium sp. AG855]|uniref:AAA family ATPase n=1 Tax=Rhizobium sp. AG855 TaxID=2183898 RepID=UPI000E71846E|nr:ATP-binding protein [Rhizobium sp. AG855]RKE83260.1 ATPase family protein associated with various cellular activities (AAA) [Rhizobium sp. AG855]